MTTLPGSQSSARIGFSLPVSGAGRMNATWWPRTLDLAVELPALIDALQAAARSATRVSYNLRTWNTVPRRVQIAGRTVHLGGFNTSDPLAISLSRGWGQGRVDVAVIAPDTDPATAEQALRQASEVGGRPAADKAVEHDPGRQV